MIELTRRSKVILVSVLSAVLLASIVFAGVLIDRTVQNAASAVTQFQSAGGNWFSGSNWFQGSVLARQTHTVALSLPKGAAFAFAAPIGTINVVPAAGNRVLVTVLVTAAGQTLAQARQRASQMGLTQQSAGSSYSVAVNTPNGLALRGLEATVEIPRGMVVTLTDHLGNVNVTGQFASLTMHANMGNCVANVKVSGTTSIIDNLGNIVCSGTLGQMTTISDHLGNIGVYLSPRHALGTTITTNLGNVNMVGAIGKSFSRQGNTWTGTIGAGAQMGTLNVSDNLGNVTLSEVNAS